MKKISVVFLLFLLILIPHTMLAEEKYVYSKETIYPDGDFKTFMGRYTVYCDVWDDAYRIILGDVSFNQKIVSATPIENAVTSDGEPDEMYLASFDGVDLILDRDYIVYGARVRITTGANEKLSTRICALISTMAYDLTEDRSEIRSRYLDLFSQYTDFYEKNYMLPDVGLFPNMKVTSPRGEYSFTLWKEEGIMYFGIIPRREVYQQ